MVELSGRARAQKHDLNKAPARAFGGVDAISKITSVASITEPAVCPDCRIVSKLVHVSEAAALAATEHAMIPSLVTGEVLRQAKCILCTAFENPVVRAQEAHAGHIWFLVGDTTDPIPNQQALNQHYWAVISGPTKRIRVEARKQILELAASKAFGSLQLPHRIISPEERAWLMGEMRRALGADAIGVLGEDAVQAYIDQFGVPLLIRQRRPTPEWVSRVRFVPTPEGVEMYRTRYAILQPKFT